MSPCSSVNTEEHASFIFECDNALMSNILTNIVLCSFIIKGLFIAKRWKMTNS